MMASDAIQTAVVALALALCATTGASTPVANATLDSSMRQLQSQTQVPPNAKCFVVPDWAVECAVPKFDKTACAKKSEKPPSALIRRGYYFNQFTCACAPADYIIDDCTRSTAANPPFTSQAECQANCYKPQLTKPQTDGTDVCSVKSNDITQGGVKHV